MGEAGNPSMQQLVIGEDDTNHMVLTTAVSEIETLKVTIVGEDGVVAKDHEGNDLADKEATVEGSKKYLDFKFDPDAEPGFYRAFWVAYDEDGARLVLESRNDPEGLRVIKAGEYEAEIVTPAFVRNTFFDKIALDGYTDHVIREHIRSAHGDLQDATQVYFLARQIIDERHDYEHERFMTNFWLKKLHHWPIVSVQKWELHYANREILVFEEGGDFEPEDYLQIDPKMGTIELLPMPSDGTGYFYSLLYGGMSEFGASLVGTMRRIPQFFRIDYTAGLDFHNMATEDKARIRRAIGRRAAIYALPTIDGQMGVASEAVSMDGVSKSLSLTSSAMYGQYSAQIEQYIKEDAQWIKNIRRLYGKEAPMVVA